MSDKLDEQYILEHLGVHNYESFGRSIVATVLEEALAQRRHDDQAELTFEVTANLAKTPSGCTWLTMIVNGKSVRIHQPPITNWPPVQ
ncbi:hypothetical protein GCM10009836_66040 [Pseudonocardia ailaonensis]|uniref:Uncharacterized protein n=1 Tax=Pseudonocardia ailaonensis TaxID=367279 RepID=A0ABN2NMH3_9PSEU